MTTSTAVESARQKIARICASGADSRALRALLLQTIRGVVPFVSYVWVLTDPETAVGADPLADVPSLAEVPRLVRLRYLTPVNRWTTLSEPPVAGLAAATRGELGRSLIWRDLLSRHDVSDVASVVFRDRFGCWAFLELWRTRGRSFEPADAAFLKGVVPPVTTALRLAQARTFVPAPPGERHRSGPLVLLLSADLDVVRQTPGTHEALRQLLPREDSGPVVPAAAYNVAAQLLAFEAGVDVHPATARVHLADGRWLTLRAARLGDDPDHLRDVAVTIEESTAAERLSLFARCFGLSEREHELLDHLAAGSDTREVAERMYLSAHTVQDHLKSVFAKTGTHSRRTLLARALGG